jgi:hypothetical protein
MRRRTLPRERTILPGREKQQRQSYNRRSTIITTDDRRKFQSVLAAYSKPVMIYTPYERVIPQA